MHRGGCGYLGASGLVSLNATMKLETTKEWLFLSLDGGAWVWTECLLTTEKSSC